MSTAASSPFKPASWNSEPARLVPTSAAASVAPCSPCALLCSQVAPSVENEWIRTTHVGSLPRAAKGQSSDIMEIVRMQLAGGIDIINDGEWSRDNYVRSTFAPTSPHVLRHAPSRPTPAASSPSSASCQTTWACPPTCCAVPAVA